jgi:CRP/FNR family cyclic AMP-dependent transcriptional regulator
MTKSLLKHIFWGHLPKLNKSNEQILSVLKTNSLFEDLSDSDLLWLLDRHLHLRQYENSEWVFKQGELGLGCYVILNGTINLHTPEGNLVKKTGDLFGEISFADGQKRLTGAQCNEECTILGLFKSELNIIEQQKPHIAFKILYQLNTLLAQRVRLSLKNLNPSHSLEENAIP